MVSGEKVSPRFLNSFGDADLAQTPAVQGFYMAELFRAGPLFELA